jgi:hypothetical protein
VADSLESAELFHVEVDEPAGVLPLVTAYRLGRLQGLQLVEAKPSGRASAPRSQSYLPKSRSGTLTTIAFDDSSLQRFEART